MEEDVLDGQGGTKKAEKPQKDRGGVSLRSIGDNGDTNPTPPQIGARPPKLPPVTDVMLGKSVEYLEYLKELQIESPNNNRKHQIHYLAQSNAFGTRCQK